MHALFFFSRSRLGGETAEVMGELLATRADMLTINITYNSLSAGECVYV